MNRVIKCVCQILIIVSSNSNCRLMAEDIETLLSRHESTRAGLRSFHVKADIYAPTETSFAGGIVKLLIGGQQELPLAYHSEWIVEGDSEKIIYTPLIDKERDGLPNNYFELIFRDGKEYLLENWDRENPQLISPSVQGSVRAYVSLQKQDFIRKDPGMFSLFLPRVLMNEPRFNLRRLIDRFASSEVVSEGDTSVVIKLKNDSARILEPSQIMEVTLSKQYGYLASSIAVVNDNVANATELGQTTSRIELRVIDFHTIGDGLYFPSLAEYTVVDSYRKTEVKMAKCQFHIVSANDDISEDIFTMNFPKDVVVVDSSVDPKTVKWILWGDGNQPAQEVKNKGELLSMDKNPAGVSKRSSAFRSILIFSILVIFSVLIFRYFKRR